MKFKVSNEEIPNKWEKNIDLYVLKRLANVDDGIANKELIKFRRPYKCIDNLEKMISKRFRAGSFTDTVTFERIRKSNEARQNAPLKYRNTIYSLSPCLKFNSSFTENGGEEIILMKDYNISNTNETSSSELDNIVERMELNESVLFNSPEEEETALKSRIISLLRYINMCDEQGTVIALLALKYTIDNSVNAMKGMEEGNGVAALLNLVGSGRLHVQLASFQLLIQICHMMYFGRIVVSLGGIDTLVELISDRVDNLTGHVVELISLLTPLKLTRRTAYRKNLIGKLACILNNVLPDIIKYAKTYKKERQFISEAMKRKFMERCKITENLVTALARLSTEPQNRLAVKEAGVIPMLCQLIKFERINILVPAYALFTELLRDEDVRSTVIMENLLLYFLKTLKSSSLDVRTNCASALALALTRSDLRKQFSTPHRLSYLVECILIQMQEVKKQLSVKQYAAKSVVILKNPNAIHRSSSNETSKRPSSTDDFEQTYMLLNNLLKAMIQCLDDKQTIHIVANLGLAEILINIIVTSAPLLLSHRQPICTISKRMIKMNRVELITINSVKCFAKLCTDADVRKNVLVKQECIYTLSSLLTLHKLEMLEACLQAIRTLVLNKNILNILLQENIFRTVFSFTLHESLSIKSESLAAATSIIKTIDIPENIIRPVSPWLDKFVKMIDALITKSHELNSLTYFEIVLKWAFTLAKEISKIKKYRLILFDHGMYPILMKALIIVQENDTKTSVIEGLFCFANCMKMYHNIFKEEHLFILISCFQLNDSNLMQATACLVHKICEDHVVYEQLHKLGISRVIVKMLGSGVKELQEVAATAICRMRSNFKSKISSTPLAQSIPTLSSKVK